ncbi:hypothetical protein EGH25_05000 [Haladaptatus sp. F3-133]|jgi:predicted nucleic acid-binding protein|uniref:Nucleic acid-binding protein, contains PIN domain n=1 Tax=Halorutilus salinus TaxID=2487751 RepID=A0A9Q4GID6_9EURY|nr:hypothetical protein [Halorutilus salinus]MCX2818708.1 hypothetical protein [Halorutilus salinus]
MRIYVDATTVISLGTAGELELLTKLDGEPVVPPTVLEEVTTEPAHANVETSPEHGELKMAETYEGKVDRAREILDENEENGDVQIVAGVLANDDTAVVSDDRRVRTVSDGLGATVTGTVGVVVRAVNEGMPVDEAKDTVRRLDGNGLHLTAELREKAYALIERAGSSA